eukprot:15436321-Alexandrium_andersonii.AAC.1
MFDEQTAHAVAEGILRLRTDFKVTFMPRLREGNLSVITALAGVSSRSLVLGVLTSRRVIS